MHNYKYLLTNEMSMFSVWAKTLSTYGISNLNHNEYYFNNNAKLIKNYKKCKT